MSDYPESLVDKAAAALAHAYGDEAHVAEYHDEARAVLDAVTPTIRADAWDKGCDAGAEAVSECHGCDWVTEPVNPYREVAQ